MLVLLETQSKQLQMAVFKWLSSRKYAEISSNFYATSTKFDYVLVNPTDRKFTYYTSASTISGAHLISSCFTEFTLYVKTEEINAAVSFNYIIISSASSP